jgi:hypothetical protein
MRVEVPFRQIAAIGLLVFSVQVFANVFDCHATDGDSVITVQLDFSAPPAKATVQVDERILFFSPLERNDSVVLYSEMGPGSDDERFVTYRMLRFDLDTGQLDYVRHIPEFEYIQARCSPR